MNTKYKGWKQLFLFSLGLFAATAFCMKWMEGDFIQNGQTFTVIGLELTYPKEKMTTILSGIDEHVKTILRYHLTFDFVFMAGVYPGIAALCMMARKKHRNAIGNILVALAVLQLVAWGADIYENSCLLKWIRDPASINNFGTYHLVVYAKWIIALAGALLGITMIALKGRKTSREHDPTLEQTV